MFECDNLWDDTAKEVLLSESLFGVANKSVGSVHTSDFQLKESVKKKRKRKRIKKKSNQSNTLLSINSDHLDNNSMLLENQAVNKDDINKRTDENETEPAEVKDKNILPNKKRQKLLKISPSKKPSLTDKLTTKLQSSRFRYINEQLYTRDSKDAVKLFEDDPEAFNVYHSGFLGQVAKWPVKPLDIIVKWIKARPANLVVADFGCGEAFLAQSVKNTVHSFDLVALNGYVTVADMTKVPLESSCVDIVVFCLSLMGTNMTGFLIEANRVLKIKGILKIAEVASRFGGVKQFSNDMKKLGFNLIKQDTSNSHFYMFDFVKAKNLGKNFNDKHCPGLRLKPCLYKKR